MNTIQADARSTGRRAAHSPAFEVLARLGFVARGVIYATIGLLAIQVAIHSSNEKTNQRGAMQSIEEQPFGHWLLVAVAVGLGGYALWRFVQAFFGHGPEGGGDSSKMGRVVATASGVSYAVMCALAVAILLGSASQSSSSSPHTSAAGVLGWPGGQWIVGAVSYSALPRSASASTARSARSVVGGGIGLSTLANRRRFRVAPLVVAAWSAMAAALAYMATRGRSLRRVRRCGMRNACCSGRSDSSV